MSNKLNFANYIFAYNILYQKIFQINHYDSKEDSNDKTTVILYDQNPSAEEKTIKKNLWENLSLEAKEIISTIINSPNELLTAPLQRLTLNRVQKYFLNKWKSKFIVDKTIREIKNWLSKI